MRIKKTQVIKQFIKSKVEEIRSLKEDIRRSTQDQLDTSRKQSDLYGIRRRMRHFHIAYCELLGTDYNKIEKPRDTNKPNPHLITTYKEQILKIAEIYDETNSQPAARD